MSMASSSGNYSISTKSQSSGSEGDLQVVIDERKNKRKRSNRESARRSRMRKRKHLDELTKQVSQLAKGNGEILGTIDNTTQQYLNVEAENSILRAQMEELSQRLQSLNDIVDDIINFNNATITTTTYARDCYLTSAQNLTTTTNPFFSGELSPSLGLCGSENKNDSLFSWSCFVEESINEQKIKSSC